MTVRTGYCDECGGRLTLFVVGVCGQCSYVLTGEDPERDARERRSAPEATESPREGTEA